MVATRAQSVDRRCDRTHHVKCHAQIVFAPPAPGYSPLLQQGAPRLQDPLTLANSTPMDRLLRHPLHYTPELEPAKTAWDRHSCPPGQAGKNVCLRALAASFSEHSE